MIHLQCISYLTKICGQLRGPNRGNLVKDRSHAVTVSSAQLQAEAPPPFLVLPNPSKISFCLVWSVVFLSHLLLSSAHKRYDTVCTSVRDLDSSLASEQNCHHSFRPKPLLDQSPDWPLAQIPHSAPFPQSSFAAPLPHAPQHHQPMCQPKVSPGQKYAFYKNYIDNNLPVSHHFHVMKLPFLTQSKIFINPPITKEIQTMF